MGDVSALVDFSNTDDYGPLPEYAGGPQDGRTIPACAGQNLFECMGNLQAPGRPRVVTEAGWQNALNDTVYKTAVPEAVSTRYVPRLMLDKFRSGVAMTCLDDLSL